METNTNQGNCCVQKFKEPKFILLMVGMILLTAIIVVSILRDRIVRFSDNQVTVYGQGKISYAPDEATVTLGVQVDKVWSAEEALRQLNDKIKRIIDAEKAIGISEEDIKTESYNLYPQYDYNNGTSNVSGYSANEHLIVKVRNVKDNPELAGKVISSASGAGVNQILGVNYYVSDLNSIKQQARLAAIADAKSKAEGIFKAAGIKPGKVVGWYENNLQYPYPEGQGAYDNAIGGRGGMMEKSVSSPQVPSGTQEMTIEVGVNYEVK